MEQPFSAYEGDEPYVFVCYAHKDEAKVYADLQRLHEQGVNIWYDEGISAGKPWRAEILKALQGASQVLYYISEASLNSIHCNREIDYAIDHLPVVPIYLDESKLSPELDLALHRIQALTYKHDARYHQKLRAALGQVSEDRTTATSTAGKRPGKRFGAGMLLTSLLVLALVAVWWYAREPDVELNPDPVEVATTPTLAVLPLVNISGDATQDYFSMGFTQEIWNKVRLIPDLDVIAMTSSSRFIETTLGAVNIGQQLKADYLVEGTVNRSGNMLRVSVNLIDATTGLHVLGKDYDQEIDDVASLFAIYDELAGDIGSTLTGFIADEGQLPELPTDSLIAYELLQQGRWEFGANYQVKKALALFNQALELDPDSIEIQAAKLEVLYQVAETGEVESKLGYQIARKAANKIFVKDPNNLTALYIQANLAQALDLDFRAAIELYDRAEGAGYPSVNMAVYRALLYTNAGNPQEAVKIMERAERLDPESPAIKTFLAVMLHYAGDFGAANRKFDEALDIAPYNRLTLRWAVGCAAQERNTERLRHLFDFGSELEGVLDPHVGQLLQLFEGNPEPLRSLLEKWHEDPERYSIYPLIFTTAYFYLGDYAAHIHAYERQVQAFSMLHLTNMLVVGLEKDYWQKLEAWAESEVALASDRRALVDIHRTRVAGVTGKMHL